MNLKNYPNILLISGNGKNVGKTTISCQILEKFKEQKIIGIKISPHFHAYNETDKVLIKNDNFILIEEIKHNSGKDSSKLLDAGAHQVFFLMVKDNHLEEAFNQTLQFFDTSLPIIIESAALRNFIIPGLFILLSRFDNLQPKESMKHLMDYVDHRVIFSGTEFDFDLNSLKIMGDSSWILDKSPKNY